MTRLARISAAVLLAATFGCSAYHDVAIVNCSTSTVGVTVFSHFNGRVTKRATAQVAAGQVTVVEEVVHDAAAAARFVFQFTDEGSVVAEQAFTFRELQDRRMIVAYCECRR